MDGAVDIVFLLIIFFLVTSSFSTEVKERLALPKKRDDETPPPLEMETPPPSTPIQQLHIAIFGNNEVWFNATPVSLADTEAQTVTTELYYRTVERINEMRREAIEAGIEPKPDTGYPPLNVKLHSDKFAYTGLMFNALMASLDCKVTPELKFDQELNPDAILEEAEAIRKLLEKIEGTGK